MFDPQKIFVTETLSTQENVIDDCVVTFSCLFGRKILFTTFEEHPTCFFLQGMDYKGGEEGIVPHFGYNDLVFFKHVFSSQNFHTRLNPLETLKICKPEFYQGSNSPQ